MSREIEIKAGKRTKVLGLMIRNTTAHIEFEAHTADGSSPSGIVETSHGSEVTGRKIETHPLQPLNIFDKRRRQHIYRIHVTSDTDATLRFRTRHIREVHVYGMVAIVTVLVIAGVFIRAMIVNG